MEVEVLELGKESLEGGRKCIYRNIMVLVEMIDMREVMYDKLETGSRKVLGVTLFADLRVASADVDLF